ncbi:hypothetical protein [Actinoplanes sp. NPDC051851]|uniref:hypothetical protein n=1 Tax=Actinoplanes sp. NPDC051851 TaxID=3154753 RepID=UPI00342FDEC8
MSSFEVRPAELIRVAGELAARNDAARHPAERLATLATGPLAPGAFAEAAALAEAHTAAATRMHDLVRAAAAALGVASEMTRAAANRYTAADEDAAGSYRALGTVYVSRNTVSVSPNVKEG